MADIKEAYLHIIKHSLMGTLDTKRAQDWQFSFHSNEDFKTLMTNGSIRTLIGPKRLDNIELMISHICQNKIAGDIFEAGCWRGGALLYMKACLNLYDQDGHRILFGADLFPDRRSFINNRWKVLIVKLFMRCFPILPASLQHWLVNAVLEAFPNEKHSEETVNKVRGFTRQLSYIPENEISKTSRDDLIEAFKRYNLFDQNVVLAQGWFDQTFPTLKKQINELALLRVDVDFYQATLQTLETFYPKLATGGICIIDDYGGFEDCKKAVDEYRQRHDIQAPMHSVDGVCYYWTRV